MVAVTSYTCSMSTFSWVCFHLSFRLLMSFCWPTRRSFCLCVWTSWLKFSPVTFSMCLKRSWCLKPQCCGWINAPLVNRVLKRSDFHQFNLLMLYVNNLVSVGMKWFLLQTVSLRCSSISDCLSSAHITSTMWSSLWMWWRRTQAAKSSSRRQRTTFCWRTAVENFTAPERGHADPQVNATVQNGFQLHCYKLHIFFWDEAMNAKTNRAIDLKILTLRCVTLKANISLLFCSTLLLPW